MGKSIKKSASKVDSSPVVAKPIPKSLKKGRGEEEEQIVKKSVVSKKQKLESKKKIDLKPKKKKEPSSDEEEEEEEEVDSEADSEVDSEEDGIEVDSEDDVSEAEVSDDETAAKADGKSAAGRTLYVGNLPFKVQQSDVEEFFESAGEVVSVRLAEKDGKFRGFGHVEFATKEAAEKAVAELNGQDLLNRAVRLEMEKDGKSKDAKPFQKGEKADGVTVFVRGFGKDSSEDQIRKSLEKHFGTCGEITRVAIPKDPMGGVKGIAYIDFKDSDACTLALGKSGSKLGGQELYVDQAKPMSADGGGRGGGRGRGGRGGGRGRGRGGRDGGGRFGGRDGGGRFGGGGGRGRGRRN